MKTRWRDLIGRLRRQPPTDAPAQRPGGAPGTTGAPRTPWTRQRRLWVFIAGALLLNIVVANLYHPNSPHRIDIPYTTFKAQVVADNVASVSSTGDSIDGSARKAVQAPGSGDSSVDFHTQRPTFADSGQSADPASNLEALLEQHHVQVVANAAQGSNLLLTILISFGPTLLLVFGFLYLMRRASAGAGAGGGIFGVGKSKAKLYDSEAVGTTFADVAGIDEVKEELIEIVDFLRHPERYERLGGKVPRGVLLIGPPGTGKTLLARAVAGEAGVPFLSMSASEFVELFVGVGASRVRDLFEKARAAAPAIVFIDELDAIGRSRSSAVRVGGNDEQEQTLNQILTEMDGFTPHEGVIVIAATNRAEILDQALLRPGRFDRQVVVQPPDRAGRTAILRIHTKNVPLAADVDLDSLGSQTSGLVGAELRNLVNEAALLATRRERAAVTMTDLTDALEKVLLGAERKIVLSPADRERTAYHESGHALLGLLVPGADPVRRVSIVPRGRALGVTVQSPVDDRQNYPEDYLRARIIGALGGQAAEAMVYGVVTTGAENDLKQVTEIARQMVVRWGMSPAIGHLNLADDGDGRGLMRSGSTYSETTAQLIDSEMRRIVEECFEAACALLRDNRERLEALTTALLRDDSLDERAILATAGLPAAAAGKGTLMARPVPHAGEADASRRPTAPASTHVGT